MAEHTLDIREIPLGPHMTKYHFQQPGIPAMHKMRASDPTGRPHDHPFAMTSFVMFGGYVEEVFAPDGSSTFIAATTRPWIVANRPRKDFLSPRAAFTASSSCSTASATR